MVILLHQNVVRLKRYAEKIFWILLMLILPIETLQRHGMSGAAMPLCSENITKYDMNMYLIRSFCLTTIRFGKKSKNEKVLVPTIIMLLQQKPQ